MTPHTPVERWRSRTTFVLALAIATVGVGNLWRFGWLLGDNGGAPFLLSYLFCLLGVGVPLLAAEITLGTHGRGSPLLSVAWASSVAGRSRLWLAIPLLTSLAALVLLGACMLVGGWALLYAFEQQLGTFAAAPGDEVAGFLARQLEQPGGLLAGQTVFALVAGAISAAGVRRGLGVFAWVAVPVLVWLLGVLIRYALEFGNLEEAGAFLFAWQPLDFDGGSFLAALGHALFTLSIGVAVGMSFGAYAPGKLPVLRSVMAVALFDLVVGVAAGVLLFPILAAANVQPEREFALLFLAAPYAYGTMPFGDFYGMLFFLVTALVALGSAVALQEPLLGILVQQLRLRRRFAGTVLVAAGWSLSCLATLGISDGGQVGLLINRVSAQLLIPPAMLLLVLFVGWRLPRDLLRKELSREPDALFAVWYFLLRFVAGPVVAFAWLWLILAPGTL